MVFCVFTVLDGILYEPQDKVVQSKSWSHLLATIPPAPAAIGYPPAP